MTNTPRKDRIIAMMQSRLRTLKKGDPVSPPIISTAKYVLPGEPDTPYIYGRYANPTVETAEEALACLEGAPALAFPSGMAAILAAIFATTKPGDRILVPSDGYYNVRALLDEFLSERGLSVDMAATREVAHADLSAYEMVWLETPSNPGLDICDIKKVAEAMRDTNGYLVVDNTTLTPLLQDPLSLGADMVVSADTKAMSGHSDLLFGHLASQNEELMERARSWRRLSGSIAGPWEAYLLHRGLMTLELRLERMCTNAAAIHKAVEPLVSSRAPLLGLKYPDIGFVMGLTFETAETAERFIDTCPSLLPATSFGGVHSSAERRARWGDDVEEGYVRLSVGCEPEDLLVEAILKALHDL